jgi:hypothetical protein
MLGYSLYINTQEHNKDILKNLKEETYIFTSLHLNEVDKISLEDYGKLLQPFKEKKCNIIADISQRTLKVLDIEITDLNKLKNIGIKVARIDFGFSINEMKEINKQLPISLNASIISRKELEELGKEIDLNNVIFSHNYYPKDNSGLTPEYLMMKNSLIRQFAPKAIIQAFIVGDKKRPSIFKGLPTIEDHRYIEPQYAYLELIKKYDIDLVIVGDVSLNEKDIKNINNLNTTDSIEIETVNLPKEYLNNKYEIRKEQSPKITRLNATRIYGTSNYQKIENENNKDIVVGNITIDNSDYKGYVGEINI